jgi:hypothetical protein
LKEIERIGAFPLQCHGRWRCNDNEIYATPKEKLSRDKTSFDGLPKPHVVRNQQIDTRETQCFPQREELIGIESYPRAERSLKQVSLSRG